MVTLEEVRRLLVAHKPVLRTRYRVRRIGIFGSFARGEATPLSDIDVLVELEPHVGWEIVDLHHYLEELLGMKVDLVTQGALARKPYLMRSIGEDLVYA